MDIDFPQHDYAGYVFDLDGTLIDSMPVHFRAWDASLAAAGYGDGFSEELFYSLGGTPAARMVEILNERAGTSLEAAAVAHAKEERYLRLLPEVARIEPVVAFAERLRMAEKPIAIASGGARYVVDAALKATGLEDVFSVIVTPEDVVHGKPAPEMFLLAAERMGVPPQKCLVLEDAELGRQAAMAASMDYLLIPSAPPCRTANDFLGTPRTGP